jgi:hypothetical protein
MVPERFLAKGTIRGTIFYAEALLAGPPERVVCALPGAPRPRNTFGVWFDRSLPAWAAGRRCASIRSLAGCGTLRGIRSPKEGGRHGRRQETSGKRPASRGKPAWTVLGLRPMSGWAAWISAPSRRRDVKTPSTSLRPRKRLMRWWPRLGPALAPRQRQQHPQRRCSRSRSSVISVRSKSVDSRRTRSPRASTRFACCLGSWGMCRSGRSNETKSARFGRPSDGGLPMPVSSRNIGA